jgi:hypothetical protein
VTYFPSAEMRRRSALSPSSALALLERATVVLSLAAFSLLYGRQVLAGLMRAYTPSIWYVPDLVMIMAAVAGTCLLVVKYDVSAVIGIMLFLALLAFSVLTLEMESVALGLRLMFIFFVSYLGNFWGKRYDYRITQIIGLLTILAVVGVFYDSFVGLHFEDLTFSGVLGDRSISQQWWLSDETRRVAGFGISSTDTSLAIVFGVLIMSDREGGPFPIWFSLLFSPIALWAVWLTQQRATTVWFAILWLLVCGVALSFGRRGQAFSFKAMKIMSLVALVASAVAPFLFYRVDIADFFGQSAPSLHDRTFNVWPAAIDYLFGSPQVTLIGGGIGSIGDPFFFTNPNIYLADNMFLSVCCNIGVILGLLLWVKLWSSIASARPAAPPQNGALATLCLLLLNGITAGIIVGATGMSVLGFALGVVLRPQPKEVVRE